MPDPRRLPTHSDTPMTASFSAGYMKPVSIPSGVTCTDALPSPSAEYSEPTSCSARLSMTLLARSAPPAHTSTLNPLITKFFRSCPTLSGAR